MVRFLALVCLLSSSLASSAQAQSPVTKSKKKEPKVPFGRVVSQYGQSLADSPSVIERDVAQSVWRVFFATNRARNIVGKDSRVTFGATPSSQPRLEYGEAEVVIPTPFEIPAAGAGDAKESTSAQHNRATRSPTCRHTEISSFNKFFEEVVRTAAQSPQRDVLVYVHGYNTRFDDSLCRAAQLAQDMPFNGVVISYCWPSAGTNLDYAKDEVQAEGTGKHFWRFLVALHNHVGSGTRINIVGHGLGSRVVLQGVAAIPKNVRETRPFQHLVLAAPDIGIDKYPVIAEKCAMAARHVTVYVSSADHALAAAKNHEAQPSRAGDSSKLVLVPRVDTIDVTQTDPNFLSLTHQRGNRLVLNELFQLIKLDNPPAQRTWLQPAKHQGKAYWQFTQNGSELLQAERPTKKK